jgi:hypothetical protein
VKAARNGDDVRRNRNSTILLLQSEATYSSEAWLDRSQPNIRLSVRMLPTMSPWQFISQPSLRCPSPVSRHVSPNNQTSPTFIPCHLPISARPRIYQHLVSGLSVFRLHAQTTAALARQGCLPAKPTRRMGSRLRENTKERPRFSDCLR